MFTGTRTHEHIQDTFAINSTNENLLGLPHSACVQATLSAYMLCSTKYGICIVPRPIYLRGFLNNSLLATSTTLLLRLIGRDSRRRMHLSLSLSAGYHKLDVVKVR
jgi:hypothetical protein